ncbi:hypothetical protein QFZ22_009584 [Streptomyces canus]|uniref:Uncharacterized protein n=1 Tax=Streptomyces canus TaxID=58343 RepID=A0AAW8FUN5_9ACTN|nr:hypothetical protein [Streptomyces canus]
MSAFAVQKALALDEVPAALGELAGRHVRSKLVHVFR